MAKDKLPGYKELPIGGYMLEAGNAREYMTGEWRSSTKPVWAPDKCIHCLFCWVYCPDAAISVKDGKMTGIDYDHCKGCGICAKECPAKGKAIEMESESGTNAS
jgi:pyruvate ferredoxin oxidoreductase delta subunit